MDELLNLIEAASYLKISRQKMSSLVKERTIKYRNDPLDKRKKLFSKADLTKLKEASHVRDN